MVIFFAHRLQGKIRRAFGNCQMVASFGLIPHLDGVLAIQVTFSAIRTKGLIFPPLFFGATFSTEAVP